MTNQEMCELEIQNVLAAVDDFDPMTQHYHASGAVAESAHQKCRKIAKRFGYDWEPNFGISNF